MFCHARHIAQFTFMRGYVDDLEFETQRRQLRAIAAGEPTDLDRHAFLRRAEDDRARRRHKFRGPAHMVGMMVRQQDRVQPQLADCKFAQHGIRLARIDDGHGARVIRPCKQPDVVVLECRNWPDVQRAYFCPVAVAVAETGNISMLSS